MKKNRATASLLAIFTSFTLSACFDRGHEDVALSDVPANITNIVQNALPGISLSEAEKKVKDNQVIYKLEGKLLDGKEYDIKISSDGTIIKIKLDD